MALSAWRPAPACSRRFDKTFCQTAPQLAEDYSPPELFAVDLFGSALALPVHGTEGCVIADMMTCPPIVTVFPVHFQALRWWRRRGIERGHYLQSASCLPIFRCAAYWATAGPTGGGSSLAPTRAAAGGPRPLPQREQTPTPLPHPPVHPVVLGVVMRLLLWGRSGRIPTSAGIPHTAP